MSLTNTVNILLLKVITSGKEQDAIIPLPRAKTGLSLERSALRMHASNRTTEQLLVRSPLHAQRGRFEKRQISDILGILLKSRVHLTEPYLLLHSVETIHFRMHS